MLLTDSNNRTVTGTYQGPDVAALEAVLSSAIDFAKTDEGIGQTTRFADKTTKAAFVDVEKTVKASRYYLTLSFGRSRVTADRGTLNRSGKPFNQTALVLDILEKIKAAREDASSK